MMVVLLCCTVVPATLASAAAGPLSSESQKVYDTKVKPFLKAHCFKCHDDKDTEAGFRIDNLETDFLAGKTADHWKEIYDRLGVGKMPPRKELRPEPGAVADVMDWINRELRNAEKRAKNSSGRIPSRRLNRTEYVNTLRDLFYLDDNFVRALEEELPMDGKVDGFDRGGASLFIDEAQLVKYLEVAELVLNREVFAPQPKMVNKKYLAREGRWLYPKYEDKFTELMPWTNEYGKRPRDRVTVEMGPTGNTVKNGGREYITAGKNWGGEIGLRLGNWYLSYDDPLRSGKFQDGWYRLKLRAGAFKGSGDRAVDEVRMGFRYTPNTPIEAKASVVIDAPLDEPRDFEMKVFLRAGLPEQDRNYRLIWNGANDVIINNPIIDKLEDEWNRKYRFRITGLTQRKRPPEEIDEAKKQIEEFHQYYNKTFLEEVKVAYAYNPAVDLQTLPRLWIESFTIEGPLLTWPPKGRTEIFFVGEEQEVDKKYIREIFARFLPRAYRRPVEPKEVDELVAWVLKTQEENSLSGSDAVREGVKAVLCSSGFLMIQEPAGAANKPRKLSDYELAARLSYFLWSSMPDAELSKLAAENKLHEPKTLQAQVRRMLADPKAIALVGNFTGQWLKVREFPNVITDRQQYKSYDDEFRESSRREPYEFFKEVLDKDLSILNFVDSDFLVIDERLAKHYGIDGVKGSAFRRVAIRPEHHRGGVLGMAGVLTYLTDGLRTLPVRRAAYVLETLWNAPPPPPPPNAGDLPPVEGKNLTVRQRLEKHRNSAICASCHARIDPFGVALENYDAIGAWRERQNGERFKGDDRSPPLDVSGVLPSGREFKNLQEYKQALLAEKERFVRGFVEKMLTYALGRSVGATDRGTVDEIVKALEPEAAKDEDKYRLQALLQAIVASPVFQTK
jgi:hypothetical protein